MFHVAYRHKKELTNESLTPLLNSRNNKKRGYPTILGHIKWHLKYLWKTFVCFWCLNFCSCHCVTFYNRSQLYVIFEISKDKSQSYSLSTDRIEVYIFFGFRIFDQFWSVYSF